ncbi:glycosyltransferase [candidate division KSB3 bacterium]|uniref:Glycosyltransferase n=1 Tax=candidate division KSB3 bacterium TaxID=2044937 RepID=A0A9D5JUA4_9BACT|nr:glycosyltransferase [candidate division KSB3 bacterium]MBD3324369.1 glycosyltransferase [candidate division KSB3 bacterium]
MRVGIDARKIRDFGIGTYIEKLIRYLPEHDADNEYYLFHAPAGEAHVPQPGSRFHLIAESSPKYSLRELAALPLQMRRLRLDLFHAPHYTLPPIRPCPGVVTIHDVIHLKFPDYLPHPFAAYYARGMMWAAARSAQAVITVSECSKRDIIHFLKVPDDKVHVIYNGIDVQVEVSATEATHQQAMREQFGLSGPYILYLGNFMPHKNLDTLVKAYSRLKHRHHLPHRLVLAGKNERMRQQLQAVIAQERVEEDVLLTGFVEPAWVPALYRCADLFVYPSLYEGFGLQALEAMAFRVPVALAGVAALPEIAGDAAVQFDPRSADHMAEVMHEALTDQPLRRTLIERGRKRIKRFSWREMARQTVAIYQQALTGVSP